MTMRTILPIKLSLPQGDVYTLWAPKWRQHGTEWQAFLGNDETVLGFHSEAELLAFLEAGKRHDLLDHPDWEAYNSSGDDRVRVIEANEIDLVGLPGVLAERPGYQAVSTVSKGFQVAESLASVAGADHTTIFFASHSVLRNVNRGVDHFSGDEGLREWSGVGHVVLANWQGVMEDLDKQVTVVPTEEFDADVVKDAESRIAAAFAATEARIKKEHEEIEAAQVGIDPYDESLWGTAGIDPVKITIDSKSVYTLRTYVNERPVFLGKWGQIYTFPTPKQLLRWIIENDDHDLASLSTWSDVVAAANAGEAEFTVHADNTYSFQGMHKSILEGPDSVDAKQMRQCYDLCADAADWARDDSVNQVMLANPRFQDYLAYMLGGTEHAGYVPSKPYTDHANAWKSLEEILVGRFSKF